MVPHLTEQCAQSGNEHGVTMDVKDSVYFHISDITQDATPTNNLELSCDLLNGHACTQPTKKSHDYLNQDANSFGFVNGTFDANFGLMLRSPSVGLNIPSGYRSSATACSERCGIDQSIQETSEESETTHNRRQVTQEGAHNPDGHTPAARKKFLVLSLDAANWMTKISSKFREELEPDFSFGGLGPDTDELRSMSHSDRVWTMVLINSDHTLLMQKSSKAIRDDLVWFAQNGGSVMFLSGFITGETIVTERLHSVWRSFGLPWCNVPGYYRTPVGQIRLPSGRVVDGGERLLHGSALHQVPNEHKDRNGRYLCAGWQNADEIPSGFRDQDVVQSGPVPFALAQVGKGWVGYFGLDSGYGWEDEMYMTLKRVCGIGGCVSEGRLKGIEWNGSG